MKACIGPGTRYGWRGALAFPGDFFDVPAGAIVGSASLSISATGTLVDAAASSTPVFSGGTASGVITNGGRTWAYVSGGTGTGTNVVADTPVTGKKYVEFELSFVADTYICGCYYANGLPVSLTESDAIPYMQYGTPNGGAIVSKWNASFMANYGMAGELSGALTPTPDGTVPVVRTIRMLVDAGTRQVQFALDGGSFTTAATIPGVNDIYVAAALAGSGTANSVTLRLVADHAYSTPVGYTDYMADSAPAGAMVGAAALSVTQAGLLRGAGRLIGATPLALTPTGLLRGSGRLIGSAALSINGSATGRRTIQAVGTAALSVGGSAALSAAGRLIGSSALALAASATVTAPSGLVGAATLSVTPAGALTGTGVLTGSAALILTPSAAGSLQVAIAGAAAVSITASAALTAAGALIGAVNVSLAASGTVGSSLPAVGTAALSVAASGTLVGTAPLAGTSTLSLVPSAALVGAGVLGGTSALSLSAAAELTGQGTINIVGSAALSITASATAAVEASLEGTAVLSVATAGALAGAGALVGATAATITATTTGNLLGALNGTALIAVAMTAELLARAALFGNALIRVTARATPEGYVPPVGADRIIVWAEPAASVVPWFEAAVPVIVLQEDTPSVVSEGAVTNQAIVWDDAP